MPNIMEKPTDHITEETGSTPEASEHQSPSPAGPELSGWRLKATLTAVFIGLFLSMLDTTIVVVALPTIADHFGGFDQSTWVINAYLLSYMAFSIIISRLSDIFGRKFVEAASMVTFMAFSLACARSTSMTELIVFRAMQGLGGSGLYSSTMVIATSMVPPKRAGIAAAAVSICIVAAGILGPLLGGAITHNRTGDTWRWVFYINLPITAVSLTTLLLAWPSDQSRKRLTWASLRTVDFLGCLLLLAASTLLIFSLEEAGTYVYPWDSPALITCLAVSSACFVAFVAWQEWLFGRPDLPTKVVFPVHLINHRVFTAALGTTMLSGFMYYIAVVNLSERFQIVSGDSPILAGVKLLPMLVSSGMGAIIGGAASVKRNNTAYTLVTSAALQLLGYGLMSTLGNIDTVPAKVYGFQVFLGLGFGMSMSSATQMVNLQVEPQWLAVSQGALAQMRTLGGSIGLSIAVIILNHKLRVDSSLIAATTPSQRAALYKSTLALETFSPAQDALVAHVFSAAFTEQMRVAMYIGAAGLLLSLATLQRHPPPVQARAGPHQTVRE